MEGIQQRREKGELERGDGRNKNEDGSEGEKQMSWEAETEGIRRKTAGEGEKKISCEEETEGIRRKTLVEKVYIKGEGELERGDGRNEYGCGRNTTKERR